MAGTDIVTVLVTGVSDDFVFYEMMVKLFNRWSEE